MILHVRSWARFVHGVLHERAIATHSEFLFFDHFFGKKSQMLEVFDLLVFDVVDVIEEFMLVVSSLLLKDSFSDDILKTFNQHKHT